MQLYNSAIIISKIQDNSTPKSNNCLCGSPYHSNRKNSQCPLNMSNSRSAKRSLEYDSAAESSEQAMYAKFFVFSSII